nr:MAG TPA: hypothetical protein [Caudoviricetes sp.]
MSDELGLAKFSIEKKHMKKCAFFLFMIVDFGNFRW